MAEATKLEHKLHPFKYETPELRPGRGKGTASLARTDVVGVSVQAVSKDGGETNLHAHPGTDGVWYVLAGKANFYDDDDHLACELGPGEGVLIPHGVKYWFENGGQGEELLEIMHITGKVPGAKQERMNYAPVRPTQEQRGINVYEMGPNAKS